MVSLGLLINFIGSLLITFSVGQIGKDRWDGGYTTLANGKSYSLAYITRPKLLKFGLIMLTFGFILQIIPSFINIFNTEFPKLILCLGEIIGTLYQT